MERVQRIPRGARRWLPRSPVWPPCSSCSASRPPPAGPPSPR